MFSNRFNRWTAAAIALAGSAIVAVPGGVLAPADGRVIGVDELEDPFAGPAVRVSIFLSPLDVHVNRSPIAGLVVGVAYSRGRFVAAYDPAAGEVNERCVVHLQGESARVTVLGSIFKRWARSLAGHPRSSM